MNENGIHVPGATQSKRLPRTYDQKMHNDPGIPFDPGDQDVSETRVLERSRHRRTNLVSDRTRDRECRKQGKRQMPHSTMSPLMKAAASGVAGQ